MIQRIQPCCTVILVTILLLVGQVGKSYGWWGSDVYWEQVSVSPDQKWVAYLVYIADEEGKRSEMDGSVFVTEVATGKTRIVAQYLYDLQKSGDIWVLGTPWGLFWQPDDSGCCLPSCLAEQYTGAIGYNANKLGRHGISRKDQALLFEKYDIVTDRNTIYMSVNGATAVLAPTQTRDFDSIAIQSTEQYSLNHETSWPYVIPPAKIVRWLADGTLVVIDGRDNVFTVNIELNSMEHRPDWKPAYDQERLWSIATGVPGERDYQKYAHLFLGCSKVQAFTRRRCYYEEGGYASDEIWIWDGEVSNPPKLLVPTRGNWTPRFP